jgi:hypothetical protein
MPLDPLSNTRASNLDLGPTNQGQDKNRRMAKTFRRHRLLGKAGKSKSRWMKDFNFSAH